MSLLSAYCNKLLSACLRSCPDEYILKPDVQTSPNFSSCHLVWALSSGGVGSVAIYHVEWITPCQSIIGNRAYTQSDSSGGRAGGEVAVYDCLVVMVMTKVAVIITEVKVSRLDRHQSQNFCLGPGL